MGHHVPVLDTGLLECALYHLPKWTIPHVLQPENRGVLLGGIANTFLGDTHAHCAFAPPILHREGQVFLLLGVVVQLPHLPGSIEAHEVGRVEARLLHDLRESVHLLI